jgi:hypothetical protein
MKLSGITEASRVPRSAKWLSSRSTSKHPNPFGPTRRLRMETGAPPLDTGRFVLVVSYGDG